MEKSLSPRVTPAFGATLPPLLSWGRQIDRDYAAKITAEATVDLLRVEAAALQLNATNAVRMHNTLGAVSDDLRATAAAVGAVSDGVARLCDAQLEANAHLVDLERVCAGIEDEVASLHGSVREMANALVRQLSDVVRLLDTQRLELKAIAFRLENPLGTQARELRREARRWLRMGLLRLDASERELDWTDALKLLQEVVQNPIGHQDSIAWFEIGYLRWKLQNDLRAAEDAFLHAQRLCGVERDALFVESARHVGGVRYEAGDYRGALEALRTARTAGPNAEVLFDLARYAARAGAPREAEEALSQAIDLSPNIFVRMFDEPDFHP